MCFEKKTFDFRHFLSRTYEYFKDQDRVKMKNYYIA